MSATRADKSGMAVGRRRLEQRRRIDQGALALPAHLLKRGIEAHAEGFGFFEQLALFGCIHSGLDPLHQGLLLLGNDGTDVDASESRNLQGPKVQPCRSNTCPAPA
jgi:hypothetical protein